MVRLLDGSRCARVHDPPRFGQARRISPQVTHDHYDASATICGGG
jgi:hypothetical protein